MKTAFIVNSVAVRRSRGRWQRVENRIKSNGHKAADFWMTESLGEATRLAVQAVESGCQMVVAVGGDGTVNEVVNGLFRNGAPLNSELVLGIIPLGSGCDLARSLGITFENAPALKSQWSGQTRKLDIGKVEFTNLQGQSRDRLFVNIADLGAGGLVVERAGKAPAILGPRPNYVWGILTAAVAYRAREVAISVDGESPVNVAIRNAIVANGRYFGRGFLAAPEARMDDGLFDIICIGNLGTLEAIWNVPRLRNGTHLSHRKVSHRRGRRVEVTSEEDVLLEMDGDLVGTLPVTCEVIPAAINVMV